MTRWLENFEEERKVELDTKISGHQPQSTTDGSHVDGITLNCGANLKKTKQKNHQNIKGQIYYLSKLGGEIKAFRRRKATKLLNSLSAKG